MNERAASFDPQTGLEPAIALKVASQVKMHWAPVQQHQICHQAA